MIKNNKGKLIIASVITLLPMLLALLAKILPEEIAVHWGLSGEADGFASPTRFFLIIPPTLLAVYWLCLILCAVVEKNSSQNKKLMSLMFWLMPFLSIFVCGFVFFAALGYTKNLHSVVLAMLAIVFIFIGNYLPKTTRNLTMGIKVRWAIASDENWNATHRFAGKVYVCIGALCIVGMFLPLGVFVYILFGIVLIGVFAPVLYSYLFYRKQLAEGKITKESFKEGFGALVKNKKAAVIVTVCITAVLAIVFPLLMFTGNVETALNEESLTVTATFWEDITVKYEDVDSVEYRAEGVEGERISGFGSARLLLGNFKNEELGSYTRYTYAKKSPCVVLRVDKRILVLGAKTEQETKAIYEHILAETAK